MYCHSERSEESPENKLAMRFFVVTLLRMTPPTLISGWKLVSSIVALASEKISSAVVARE